MQPADAAPAVPDAPESATGKEAPRDKVQERFDKLTREKYDALRQVDQLQYRLSELEAKVTAPKAEEPVKLPTLESVGFDEAKYQAALIEFARNEARAAALSEMRSQAQARESQEKARSFEKRQAEFMAATPDYADKVHRDLPISKAMAEIIRESEVGPQVAYFLGNNPDKAAAISSMSSEQAAREIGRIEARIELEKAKPKPLVSSAPPPPAKIDAVEPTQRIRVDTADSDQLSDAEWVRRRNAQISKRKSG